MGSPVATASTTEVSTATIIVYRQLFTVYLRLSRRIPDARCGLANSYNARFGGSGVGVIGEVEAEGREYHDRPASLALTVPPLGVLVLEKS